MVDEATAILLLICLHEVCIELTYDWSLALCLTSTQFSLVKATT